MTEPVWPIEDFPPDCQWGNVLPYGLPVLGGAWNDGFLPAPNPLVHRFGAYDDTGLLVALCGERQVNRSNGWCLYRPDSPTWVKFALQYGSCARCDASLENFCNVL